RKSRCGALCARKGTRMTGSPAERVNRDDIVALASRLIATQSTSGEERVVMDDVVAWCAEQGISCEVVSLDPARPNVIVTLGDGSAGPTVVMNGHLDTVPVSDEASWQSPPFVPTLNADGSKLVGRGASDMKSAVAVMLYVMQLLKDTPLKGRVQVHVVSDEEVGGKFGTIFVLDEVKAGRLPRPDYCLIGEKS